MNGEGAELMTSMAPRRRSTVRVIVAAVFASTLASWPASGQDGIEQKAAIAVAESALAAISRGDMTALTDLMLPEAVMFPTRWRGTLPATHACGPARGDGDKQGD